MQLEANLRRVVPGATGDQLRQLSRAGMRSYLRYFMEAFRLPVMHAGADRARGCLWPGRSRPHWRTCGPAVA